MVMLHLGPVSRMYVNDLSGNMSKCCCQQLGWRWNNKTEYQIMPEQNRFQIGFVGLMKTACDPCLLWLNISMASLETHLNFNSFYQLIRVPAN